MHLNSELMFQKYALPYFTNKLKIIEIGPSSFPSPYKKIVNNNNLTWDTIDFVNTEFVDSAAIQNLTFKLKSSYSFPIADSSYDIVVSGQVLEHVEKIWVWLGELKRIVKPGGYIITINPVSWPYHEAPVDCWRAFPSGIRALADEHSLEVELCIFASLEAEEILNKDKREVHYGSTLKLMQIMLEKDFQ